jgi:hypothetical protein
MTLTVNTEAYEMLLMLNGMVTRERPQTPCAGQLSHVHTADHPQDTKETLPKQGLAKGSRKHLQQAIRGRRRC